MDAPAAEPTPQPDDGQEPAPTPAATPVASPSTTPEPVPDPTPADPAADLPAEVRTPTGRDGEPLASGRVEGDDGCLLDGLLCLGMSLEDAEAAIATAPQPVAVWLSSTGDAVGSVLVLPSDGPAGPFLGTDGDLRVADVLRRLGAPAEIRFESGPDPDGVEIRTFWLIYETDAGVIGYGVTTSDPEDTLLVDPGEDRVPEEFDSLLITSYQAARSG